MTHTEDIISFQGVSKAWGSNTVLNQLDFTVSASEKVAIIGPSGSGKTTILRILMTIEKPNSGEVLVAGDSLWNEREIKRKRRSAQQRKTARQIGMVFQHFNLFPHMTVLDNITEAPIHVLKRPRKEVQAEARELLERVGLADHMNHRPAKLSGGQMQRVAIVRALAMNPRILLFDEPTSALDPELVGEVLNVVRTLAEQTSITMLIVTHEISFAEEIADRMVMFDEGRVIEDGSPHSIITKPLQERTRNFLSSIRR